jgi:formate hydrogenlyase subunit 4
MDTLLLIAAQAVSLLLFPLLLAGIIRKAKALMQNRPGPPLLQPFYDLSKMARKTQAVSRTASWVFRLAPSIGLATAALAAALTPWAGALLPDAWAPASNLLLIVYLLVVGKFFMMLAAIDTGSAFGGLGASREAAVSALAELTIVIALAALALEAGSPCLCVVFSTPISPFVAVFAGAALIMAALAELSRMPVDDPTTHLELTMIHEAMVLEYSGWNLAVIEYTAALRTCIFFGLALQALFQLWPAYLELPLAAQFISSLAALACFGAVVAVAEGVLVKLKWRKIPSFLGFAAVLSLLAALVAAAQVG